MEYKQIQDLIKLFSKSGLSELKLEEEDFKLTLKNRDGEIRMVSPVAQQPMVVAQAPAAPQMEAAAPTATTPVSSTEGGDEENSNYITVNSPMIGTFYRSSGPDKPPFVKVGDTVEVGDVLCIIEAMKLFNEIESEVSGKIVKVLIEDASPVEYDQPLFLVDPS